MDRPSVPSAFDTLEDCADAHAFLTAARAIIVSPAAWAPRCQWALDPDGAAVDAHDPLAVRWSASAALRVAARRAGGNAVWLGWKALDDSVGPNFTRLEWAADTTHEVMLRVFDLALRRLEAATSPEEAARLAIDAAFGRAEDTMRKHGLDEAGVTSELVSQAMDRLWDDEDREGLRAKAHAAVSAYVDALFDGIGDRRVAA